MLNLTIIGDTLTGPHVFFPLFALLAALVSLTPEATNGNAAPGWRRVLHGYLFRPAAFLAVFLTPIVLYKGGADNFGANLAYVTILCLAGALVPANNRRLISYFLPEDNRKRPRAQSNGSNSGPSTTGSDDVFSDEAVIDESIVDLLPRNVRKAYRDNVKKLSKLNADLEDAKTNLRAALGETQTAHDRRRRTVADLNAKLAKCKQQVRYYEEIALQNSNDNTDNTPTVSMHFRGDEAVKSRDAAVISVVDKLSSVLSTAFNAVAGGRHSASTEKNLPTATITANATTSTNLSTSNTRSASRGKSPGSRANTPAPAAPSSTASAKLPPPPPAGEGAAPSLRPHAKSQTSNNPNNSTNNRAAPSTSSKAGAGNITGKQSEPSWPCPSCTLMNTNADASCSACRAPRPTFAMDPDGTSAEARAAVERGKRNCDETIKGAIDALASLPSNSPPKSTPAALATFSAADMDGSQRLCCLYAVMYCLGISMTAPNAFLYARAMLFVTDAMIGYFGCKGANGKIVPYEPKKEEFNRLRRSVTNNPVDLADIISHKGSLKKVINNASTGLDHAMTCFITCIMFTNIPMALMCATIQHDGNIRLDASATTSPPGKTRKHPILGNLIFVPSGSDYKGASSGHYWAIRPGWGFADHHAAHVLSRLLYIFSLSTGDTHWSPGGPQLVLRKALDPSNVSYLTDFVPAPSGGGSSPAGSTGSWISLNSTGEIRHHPAAEKPAPGGSGGGGGGGGGATNSDDDNDTAAAIAAATAAAAAAAAAAADSAATTAAAAAAAAAARDSDNPDGGGEGDNSGSSANPLGVKFQSPLVSGSAATPQTDGIPPLPRSRAGTPTTTPRRTATETAAAAAAKPMTPNTRARMAAAAAATALPASDAKLSGLATPKRGRRAPSANPPAAPRTGNGIENSENPAAGF
jgi:hypothetical protein